MGITRAALSQHLKALEQRLNVRLLHRTTRNLSLTEEGRLLLEVLQPALTSIQRAVNELDGAGLEPSGLLRVNTSRIAAKMLLEPHMGEFLARFPKLQLQLQLQLQLELELVMDDGLSRWVRCRPAVWRELGRAHDGGAGESPDGNGRGGHARLLQTIRDTQEPFRPVASQLCALPANQQWCHLPVGVLCPYKIISSCAA